MTELLNMKEVPVTSGRYNISVIIATGDIKLQYSVLNQAFIDIPDSTNTASTGFSLLLPECRVRAVISDVASKVFLTVIRAT